MVDDCFFQFRFDIAGITGKAEKFKDCRIFDKFQLVLLEIRCFFLHFRYNKVFFLGGQKALVVKGGNIFVQSSDRQIIGGSFGEVILHGIFIGKTYNKPEMRCDRQNLI